MDMDTRSEIEKLKKLISSGKVSSVNEISDLVLEVSKDTTHINMVPVLCPWPTLEKIRVVASSL